MPATSSGGAGHDDRTATSVADLLRARWGENPDGVALRVVGGESLTWRQWESRSNAAARGLLARGVGAGDRVALLFENDRWTDYAVCYLAVHKAGAVAVPVGLRFTGHELEQVVGHSQACGVVCPPGVAVPGGLGWVAHPHQLEDGQATIPFQVAAGAEGLAEIIYTSGTTGAPKGVACSHASLLAYDLPSGGEDEGRAALMLHAFPVGTNAAQECLRMPLRRAGSSAAVLPAFDPDRLCAAVEEHRVSRLQLVPAMAQTILTSGAAERHDVSSVERITLSSAPAPPTLFPRLAAAFPGASVWNAYALTESGTARTLMRYDGRRSGSVGRPVGRTEVRVVDEEGREAPGGEVGEVWLRREGAPRREYYRDAAATEAAFAGDWLRTGDVGYLDGEGFLYLVDRRKDVIVTGGFNVACIEVESALHEHEDVVEAAVFGVPHPVLGQDVAAAVVGRPGTSGRELQSFLRRRLGEHKVPRHVFLVESLPRNVSGKVVKDELRERFAGRTTATGVGPRDEVETTIADIWREVLDVDAVGVHDDFFDLGGHSLAATQVVARLQDALRAPLPLTAVFECPTVAELAAAAREAGARGAGAGAG